MDRCIGRSSLWLLAATVLLAILGACTSDSTDDRRVDEQRVPDVLGLTISEACTEVSEEGYEIKVVADVDDMTDICARPGTVTDQTPSPGTALEPGSIVTVHVSPTKSLPDG